MARGIYDRTKSKPLPRKRFFYDKEWLADEYLNKGKGSSTIAKELDVSTCCVQYWLDRFGIRRRNANDKIYAEKRRKLCWERRKYKIDKDILEDDYAGGKKTINQIAKEFSCSWDTVRKLIHRYGIKMRNQSRRVKAPRKRTITEVRNFQKKLLGVYGYKCAICGYDKFVVMHHLTSWSVSQDDSLENGICLCPNHHAESDYGLINVETLKKYQVVSKQDKVRHSEQSENNK